MVSHAELETPPSPTRLAQARNRCPVSVFANLDECRRPWPTAHQAVALHDLDRAYARRIRGGVVVRSALDKGSECVYPPVLAAFPGVKPTAHAGPGRSHNLPAVATEARAFSGTDLGGERPSMRWIVVALEWRLPSPGRLQHGSHRRGNPVFGPRLGAEGEGRGLEPTDSVDRRRVAPPAGGEDWVPLAEGAGVCEGRSGELEREGPRILGRADVLPVENELA